MERGIERISERAMMGDEVDRRPQDLWRKATRRQGGRVISVERLDGLPEPSRFRQGKCIAPRFATDQRPAQYRHGGGDITCQGMLVRQPRFPDGTPGKLVIG